MEEVIFSQYHHFCDWLFCRGKPRTLQLCWFIFAWLSPQARVCVAPRRGAPASSGSSSLIPHGLISSGCFGRECGNSRIHTKFWSWIISTFQRSSCTGSRKPTFWFFWGWRNDLAAPPVSIQASGHQGNYKPVFIASCFPTLHLKVGLFLLFHSDFERQQESALEFVTSCIYNMWRCYSWWSGKPQIGFVQCKKGFY